MLKEDEISDPSSCWNRAKSDELIFVLLERDDAFADTIEFWVVRRIALGKNKLEDEQIQNALDLAGTIRTIKSAKS